MITVIESTEAGFFANFCDVIRHIIRAEERGEKWFVNWTGNSPYYDAGKGINVWEYYFKQPLKYGDILDKELRFVRGYCEIDQKGQAFRDKFNEIITKYIHLNDEMQFKVDNFADALNIGPHTIGIHYRGTDKHSGHVFGEPSSARPLPAYRYTDKAKALIDNESYSFTNVFVMTDDEYALGVMRTEMPSINYIANITRGEPHKPVHSRLNNSTACDEASGYRRGMEVVLEVFLLSKCGYVIRSTSNVGSTAQFINKDLPHYNINEVWLGDTREQEYGLITMLPAISE